MNTGAPPIPGHSLTRFYVDVLGLLEDQEIPFLIGGAFAESRHTRRDRDTKDLDLVVRREDIPRLLDVCARAEYGTELRFSHWLAKVFSGHHYLDVVFGSGNGVVKVDDHWFRHAVKGEVLGKPLWLCPPEELLWSKAFVQERERYDGADVMHLLRACAATLDWHRLLDRFGDRWPVLLSYLVLFQFVYPDRRGDIPANVLGTLTARLLEQRPEPANVVCYGTLLSRQQYLDDVNRLGYSDARVQPHGNMSPGEIEVWTRAIAENR